MEGQKSKTTSGGFLVFQYMDVNISHLTPKDWSLLETECDCQETLIVYPREAGFFLFVTNDNGSRKRLEQLGFSDSFLAIWSDAIENGIWWVMFHEDGCFPQKKE